MARKFSIVYTFALLAALCTTFAPVVEAKTSNAGMFAHGRIIKKRATLVGDVVPVRAITPPNVPVIGAGADPNQDLPPTDPNEPLPPPPGGSSVSAPPSLTPSASATPSVCTFIRYFCILIEVFCSPPLQVVYSRLSRFHWDLLPRPRLLPLHPPPPLHPLLRPQALLPPQAAPPPHLFKRILPLPAALTRSYYKQLLQAQQRTKLPPHLQTPKPRVPRATTAAAVISPATRSSLSSSLPLA